MIDFMTLPAADAERMAYSEGFVTAAELFARIADLEAQVDPDLEEKLNGDLLDLQGELEDAENTIEELKDELSALQLKLDGLLSIRYFIVDYDLDDGPDLVEVDSHEFAKAEGAIKFERHTMFQNGCDQVCLTKGFE